MSRRRCKGTSKGRRRGHGKQLTAEGHGHGLCCLIYTCPRPKDSGSRCLWLRAPRPDLLVGLYNALTAVAPAHSLGLQGLFSDVGVREGFLHSSTQHSREVPRADSSWERWGVRFDHVCGADQIRVRPGTRQHGSCWCHLQAPRSPPAGLAAAVARATLSCPPSVLSRVPAPGTGHGQAKHPSCWSHVPCQDF